MTATTQARPAGKLDSPETLVAIARAAHVAGDRRLEQAAKRRLQEQFGITIKFDRQPNSGDNT